MSKLGEIQTRADAATEGPWEAHNFRGWVIQDGSCDEIAIVMDRMGIDDDPQAEANATFIINARQDIPTLVAALKSALEVLNDFPPPPKSADPTGEVLLWMEALAADAKQAITGALDG